MTAATTPFRHRRLLLAPLIGLLFSLGAPPALAQMPDLRSISGKPLPVNDVPPGTVVVRVVRQSLANAAVGVEVSATTRAASGDARTGRHEDRSRRAGASSRTCPAAPSSRPRSRSTARRWRPRPSPCRSRAACG